MAGPQAEAPFEPTVKPPDGPAPGRASPDDPANPPQTGPYQTGPHQEGPYPDGPYPEDDPPTTMPASDGPPDAQARQRRGPRARLRLHTMTVLTALAMGVLMAGLVLAVGGAFLRVLDLASETRTAIVPRITKQQEYAVFAARMGQLAEAVLRSRSPEERRHALKDAEAVADRFAAEADPTILNRLEQALQAVRRTAGRADGIDAISTRIQYLRRKANSDFEQLMETDAPLSARAPFFQALRILSAGMAARTPQDVDRLEGNFHAHAAAALSALIALPPAANTPVVRVARDLDELGGLFRLRRTVLDEESRMAVETEAAHRVLNDLSASLTADAASGAQRIAATLTTHAENGLLIVGVGLGTAALVQLLLYLLLRLHVVKPILRASDALTEVQRERRAVRLKPALFAELQAIGTSVERFGAALEETHDYVLALKAGEERMRAILAASPFPIVIARVSDGSVLFFNPQAEALFGVRGDRLTLTRNARFFIDPTDADRLVNRITEHGSVSELEVRLRTAEGRPFWAMISAVEIRDADEAAILVAINDITQRKRSEEETDAAKQRAERALADLRSAQESLIQAEKMASLGALVAGVAHEVNTPVGIALTGITHLGDNTRRIVRQVDDNQLRRSDLNGYLGMAGEACQLIEANLNRAVELIQSFKQTAVDQTSEERRRFDLRTYLDDVLASLRPRLKQTPHRVEVDCPDGVTVDSYPGALFQVLTNLTINSVTHAYPPEVFPDGKAGTLRIAVTCPDPTEVELVFSDDGCGIPPANRGRIFDPFFTTRRGKGGSGLGLHIVFNIVANRLGGGIRVESEEGQGTRFILRFPASVAGSALPAPTSGRTEPVA